MTQRTMLLAMVLKIPPVIVHCLDLLQIEEPFAVQQLGALAGMEAFHVAVLPWCAWLDVSGFHSGLLQSFFDRSGNELRPIVTAQMLRPPTYAHQRNRHAKRHGIAVES